MFFKHWQLLGNKGVDISTDINIPAQEVPYILIYLVKHNWASDCFVCTEWYCHRLQYSRPEQKMANTC